MWNNKIRGVVIFVAAMAGLLIIFSIMNVKRPLRLARVQAAMKQMYELDQALKAPRIDWTEVQGKYRGPLASLVKETKRFIQKADLYGKIVEAIAEGKKGSVDDVQSIIIRRTLLRVCVYHAEALLTSKDPQEMSLAMAERSERMDLFLAPIVAFANEAGRDFGQPYELALRSRWEDWTKNPTPEMAREFTTVMDGLFADAVLQHLQQWRALSLTDKEQRRKAVVHQAEMRQLFHVFYPRLYDRIRQQAWEALTEFTNDPKTMNADLIEKVIHENCRSQRPASDSVRDTAE